MRSSFNPAELIDPGQTNVLLVSLTCLKHPSINLPGFLDLIFSVAQPTLCQVITIVDLLAIEEPNLNLLLLTTRWGRQGSLKPARLVQEPGGVSYLKYSVDMMSRVQEK